MEDPKKVEQTDSNIDKNINEENFAKKFNIKH